MGADPHIILRFYICSALKQKWCDLNMSIDGSQYKRSVAITLRQEGVRQGIHGNTMNLWSQERISNTQSENRKKNHFENGVGFDPWFSLKIEKIKNLRSGIRRET